MSEKRKILLETAEFAVMLIITEAIRKGKLTEEDALEMYSNLKYELEHLAE